MWGFCTELSEVRTGAGRKRCQLWTRIIFGGQIMCAFTLSIYVWTFFERSKYDELDLLSIANDVIKMCGAVAVYWFIIFESYWKRHEQRKFWRIYRLIRADFNRIGRNASFVSYFMKFGEFFVVALAIEIGSLSRWFTVYNAWNFFYAASYFSLMIMQDMRIFHYLFFVHLLDHQLHEAGLEMKVMADMSENRPIPRDRHKWMRIYYDLVHELSECINEVFGWSHIGATLYCFLRLVVDLNCSYWLIHNGKDVTTSSSCILHFVKC